MHMATAFMQLAIWLLLLNRPSLGLLFPYTHYFQLVMLTQGHTHAAQLRTLLDHYAAFAA
jgi:hypothetical protein